MRGALLAVILLCWAGGASAQAVSVRSGEHADFTRLVIKLPERAPYTLTGSGVQTDLVIDGQDYEIDTSAVFDRVPKTRLTGIAALPGHTGLRLSLAPGYEVKSYWFGNASLVLDIRRGEQPAKPVRLRPLPVPPPRPGHALRLLQRDLDRRLAMKGPPASPNGPDLGISRDLLLRQVGRAASQGLLTPMARRIPPPAPPQATPEPVPQKPAARARPSPPGMHLHAQTAIDRDMGAVLARLGAAGAQTCLDPERVDVAAWGGNASFRQQIGPLRARLLGEFDKPDRAAVLRLARLYVHFGFGAEARQLLAEVGGSAAADPVLEAMAAILEDGHAGADSALSGQTDCGPMVALWSALSYPEMPAGISLNGDAVLQGLTALPVHLRAYLGPVLARRLHEAGYKRESARARRVLNRVEATTTAEVRLMDAEVALSRGPDAPAEATLGTLVADNDTPSAQALLRLIDARLRRGAEISYETAQLAGAYAVEYRGQPLGTDLAEAHLAALASSGAFDEAFAELDQVPGADAAGRAASRARLSGMLASKASDYDFLHHTLSGSAAPPDGLDAETGNVMADRLISLGFPAEAARYVAPHATGPEEDVRKRLRARVALAQGRPRQAEAKLLGLSDKAATRLRAEARARAGDHQAAQELFDAVGEPDAAQAQAWLAYDWVALLNSKDTTRAAIARLKLTRAEAEQDGDSQGVLARNAAMIEGSQAARAAIAALLSAHPPPQ